MLFSKNQKGQGLVEYALILVLVSIVTITALTLLGPSISEKINSITASISGGTSIVGQSTMRQALQAYCGDSRTTPSAGIDQYQNSEGLWVVVARSGDGTANPDAVAEGYVLIENAACSQLDGAYPP